MPSDVDVPIIVLANSGLRAVDAISVPSVRRIFRVTWVMIGQQTLNPSWTPTVRKTTAFYSCWAIILPTLGGLGKPFRQSNVVNLKSQTQGHYHRTIEEP